MVFSNDSIRNYRSGVFGDAGGPTEMTIAPSGKTIPGLSSPAGVPSAFSMTCGLTSPDFIE
jgi:hypothetical protein